MNRLSGHKWRTTVSTATLDGRSFRVVRPARSVANASLHESWHGGEMAVHQGFAGDLVAAWWLAARSPRSLVHLPLRRSGHVDDECGDRPLDLVLLHHSLGFRPAHWKSLRARTTAGGAAHTVELPERLFPTFTAEDHSATNHREHLDELHWTIAADTLFISGSRAAFRLQGPQLQTFAEESPALLAARPDGHVCAEIGIGTQHFEQHERSPYAYLHIQICETHR